MIIMPGLSCVAWIIRSFLPLQLCFLLLPVYVEGFNAPNGSPTEQPTALSIEATPEHGPSHTIDTDHQSRKPHIHFFPLPPTKDFLGGLDQDRPQSLVHSFFCSKEI